jgi:hypothetical protein
MTMTKIVKRLLIWNDRKPCDHDHREEFVPTSSIVYYLHVNHVRELQLNALMAPVRDLIRVMPCSGLGLYGALSDCSVGSVCVKRSCATLP